MAVAGNVGTPLSTLVGDVDPSAVVVCEVSSFQLEDAMAFAPDIGAAAQPGARTTSTATARFEAYRDAKLRIFARQSRGRGRGRARGRPCPVPAR